MGTELDKYEPCGPALEYREEHPDFISAWNNCKRGDWMLWLAAKVGVDNRKLYLAKASITQIIRPYTDSTQVHACIDAALMYGLGFEGVTEDDVNEVAEVIKTLGDAESPELCDLYGIAYSTASWTGVNSTADIANTVSRAVCSRNELNYNFYLQTLEKCADICRETLTDEVLKKLDFTI